MTGPAGGDLFVAPARGLPHGLTIPAGELDERFSRSSGPGGQGVNTADSRVELRWDLRHSAAVTDEQQRTLFAGLGSRVVDGTVVVTASEHRAQLRNRQAARSRLAALITRALRPATPRRATRPSRAAVERRLDAKRRRANVKVARRRPED